VKNLAQIYKINSKMKNNFHAIKGKFKEHMEQQIRTTISENLLASDGESKKGAKGQEP